MFVLNKQGFWHKISSKIAFRNFRLTLYPLFFTISHVVGFGRKTQTRFMVETSRLTNPKKDWMPCGKF